jgi:hypothetical protein
MESNHMLADTSASIPQKNGHLSKTDYHDSDQWGGHSNLLQFIFGL